jgi:creatinine amidohydrolase
MDPNNVNSYLYAELTWPEVAKLPRDWPVLVPLNQGEYNLQEVAGRLESQNLIILPPIPYGFWCPDGDVTGNLNVRPGLFRRVLIGIQRELKTQGFQRVFFMQDHVDPEVKSGGVTILPISRKRKRTKSWPEDPGTYIAVVSTGHTEQHGLHLPLNTDSLIVAAIAKGVQQRTPDQVFCLPVWPYGVSTHTRQYPGTLNLGGRVFEDFFLATVESLVAIGFRMIYFSNGHGGNHSFIVNVVKYAGERFPQAFIATEWLHTAGPCLQQIRQSRRGGMGHGGELETSYILHLRPDLVHMERATNENNFISTPNFYMDWIEGGSIIANPPWSDDTTSGIYGDARTGSAEKGHQWLQASIEEKLETFAEIRQQHDLRQAKRSSNSGLSLLIG